MGMFYDLCIAIDLYNSSKKINKKGLINFIKKKNEEKSLKRLIHKMAIDPVIIKNNLVIDFMYTYNATKDSIDIKNFESSYNEDNGILWVKYKNKNSELSLITYKNDNESDRISVRFENLTPGTYPVTFNLYDSFYYNGVDKKRVVIMKYANDVIRTFLKDYCILRMNK